MNRKIEKKHLNVIYENYKNSKYFDECYSIIKTIYDNKTIVCWSLIYLQ